MNFNFCYKCKELSYKKYSKKLSQSHKGDRNYRYRHELPKNLKEIEKMGIEKWLEKQKTKWQCPNCSGKIKFFHYNCSNCGLKKQV